MISDQQNAVKTRRFEEIKLYGQQSMAYSCLQEGIEEFRHPSFKGFIPYMKAWGIKYVLSNPITPAAEYLKATLLFLKANKQTVFCQINHQYAVLLNCLGLEVNSFGVEHFINLDHFTVSWKERRGLKRFLSKLSHEKYYVTESIGNVQEVQPISRDWLKNKQNSKELKFLARPFAGVAEAGTRTFYLLKDKKLIGFCTFDPVYGQDDHGSPSSYVLQHLRLFPDSPNGAGDFLLVNSLLLLKEDQIPRVSLGLSPLYKREKTELNESWTTERMFTIFFKTNFLYHFQSVGEHKDRYRGITRQTYVAANKKFTLRNLLGLLKVNRLI